MGFKPLTLDEKLAQDERIARESATLAAQHTHTALIKPGPGRPRKVPSAHAMLSAAASLQPPDADAEEQQPAAAADGQQTKRGKYHNWSAANRHSCVVDHSRR